MHYFLQHDYEALLSSIEELRKRITDIGKEMGESCREGAETFHDNFAHEDATRQLGMLSLRFRDLSRIKEQATIVSVTADSTTVRIGKRIRVRETTSDTQIKIKIGSFRTFSDDEETVSYSSPVAKIIIGAKIGEIRHGTVDKKQVTYVVEGIE